MALPRYNDEGVRTVLGETHEHFAKIRAIMGEDALEDLPDSVKVSLTVHHHAILRDKRCLLAYLNKRAAVLKQLRWELGPVLPPEHRACMSHHEAHFFSRYDTLLSTFVQDVGGIDVTVDMAPPKELLVEVRVVVDCGEIMTETGSVNLEKGTTHLLRRTDVEPLVRQGFLDEMHQQESC